MEADSFLLGGLTGAVAVVGTLVTVAYRQHRRRTATEVPDHTVLLYDIARGYRAACVKCDVPVGEWYGWQAGFTPMQALAAAQADCDFHLWADHE